MPVASALHALFLGLLQGLTEFLPVSSSGHLVLFQQFLEIAGDEVLFDLVLHVGTLIPVLWFYRERVRELLVDPVAGDGPFLQRPGVVLWGLLVIASIPTAAIGLLFEDVFEALFANPASLAVTFAITGTVLLSTRWAPTGAPRSLGVGAAFVLGVVQGLAITPGISRSGSTISAALWLGLDKEQAARFSFLMSVPAISGAVLLKLKDADLAAFDPLALTLGFGAALVSGYLALALLVRLVRDGQLHHFAWYCYLAAGVAGAVAVLR